MKSSLILVVFATLCGIGFSLECYTCSVAETDPDFDKTCIDHPEELLATDCNKNYCTIIRQEYKDEENIVASMYRGCEDYPMYINKTFEDETYRFYYFSCQEPLCNGGSGKSEQF
jgi:hypothetical protein